MRWISSIHLTRANRHSSVFICGSNPAAAVEDCHRCAWINTDGREVMCDDFHIHIFPVSICVDPSSSGGDESSVDFVSCALWRRGAQSAVARSQLTRFAPSTERTMERRLQCPGCFVPYSRLEL
jgi:hypothetical protein